MNCNLFLEGAVARYKGFLHLIKRNKEMSVKCFCVPTYDIDLIWHSHQLNPASYFKDMVVIMEKVLEHDDTDSDRTKGRKLDLGFYKTTRQWEETFGSRYWKAGAMYRGKAPSSLSMNLSSLETLSLRKQAVLSNEYQNMIQLPKRLLIEVRGCNLTCLQATTASTSLFPFLLCVFLILNSGYAGNCNGERFTNWAR